MNTSVLIAEGLEIQIFDTRSSISTIYDRVSQSAHAYDYCLIAGYVPHLRTMLTMRHLGTIGPLGNNMWML